MSLRAAALCAFVVIVGRPITVQAQSASDVIERHVDAIGGRKAVERIVSTEVSGRVSTADGRSGVFTQRAKRPHSFSFGLSWGDARWRTGFNGRSAWVDGTLEGTRTLHGSEASRVRAGARYASSHFIGAESTTQLSIVARDQVRGRQVIIVAAVAPDGVRRTLFLDANSYLLVKDEEQTDAGVEERFFDDYRRVDEVLEPHRIEWHRNGETLQIAVERVAHNTPLDGAVFDAPSPPADAPLTIDAVLSAAGKNDQQVVRMPPSYAYTMTTSSGRVDEQGRFTLEEGSSSEIFHLDGRPISRLIKKRGGEPLSEAERRREDERVNALVQEYERQRVSGQRRQAPAAQGGSSLRLWVPLGTSWFPTHRRMSAFSNIRRERLGGRAVLVVEFEPKPGVAPNSDVERQAGATSGALWIDEALQTAIRVESYLSDDYERSVAGSAMRAERILVNDEVWLPSRNEMNVRHRFVFGKFGQWVNTIEFANHKKFGVATDFIVALPDAAR